ncbi:MAG: TonB-dependent receptor [Tannerella sp.]|jgi:TonB-linked SusC/RagA family outer membrane protein|nr:TonB-dependent receptor [Tannerella sp.]
MRSKLLKMLISAIALCALPFTMAAQERITVSGVVTDETGETLPGVQVVIQGSTRGVSTDLDGTFTLINVKQDDVLEFSYIGYTTYSVKVGTQRQFNVSLVPKPNELDEVTVVAFAKQKKESVIAAVTTVKPSDLKVPSSNLTTAFAGRIAGLISYQRTGEPGQDNAQFFIRGVTNFGTGKKDPLILIDGVEMGTGDLSRLTTDDIASFSIMKDANATALYGARGANGVILINTKEGREGTAKIQFRAEGSWSSPTENVAIADPVSYMKYHNEAVITRTPGRTLPYSQKKIAYTERGIDPVRYPANDWQEMLFDKQTFNQRYNLSVSGGGTVARYYVAASYAIDQGIIKNDNRQSFNTNIDIRKYSLRSNVNVNLTKTTELIVRLNGSFDDYQGPIDGGTDLYTKAINANPVYFRPYYEPDEANIYTKHILFGNYNTGAYLNPYAEMLKGYKTEDRSKMYAQFEVRQNLDFITKGLALRGLFNVDRYSLLPIRRQYFPFYYALAETGNPNDYILSPLNPDAGTDFLNFIPSDRQLESTLYFEGAVTYNRNFLEKHDVSGLLVSTVRELHNGTTNDYQLSLPRRNLGLSGRFTYSYDSRYFIELNFGYNGSERFHSSQRWGFFPSGGLGYIVSNEEFWEPLKEKITKLKLKATYGLVGNDQIGSDNDRFFYMSSVNMFDGGRGYRVGDEFGFSRSGISISRYADPNITWEIAKKQNYGIELNLWNSLEIQIDHFREKRTNILQERTSIPTTMGLQVNPRANIGEASGSGWEVSIDYSKSFTPELWTLIRGNFTYASSKYQIFEEPDYFAAGAPWRSRVGNKLSQVYGYVAERLFIDDEEVANSPTQTFGEYGAGDIKYKDINGDMRIDQNDQVPIGFPTTPEIIYGFGLSGGYKNFDANIFFQGSARSSFWINPGSTAPFVGGSGTNRAMLKVYADSHWTEDDRDIYAVWPRLSETAISNNQQTSTWFMRNGSFLRVKTAEIGYTLPKNIATKAKVANLRLYASGNNLGVISAFKMWDPEMGDNGLAYPLQRVLNIGLNIEF